MNTPIYKIINREPFITLGALFVLFGLHILQFKIGKGIDIFFAG